MELILIHMMGVGVGEMELGTSWLLICKHKFQVCIFFQVTVAELILILMGGVGTAGFCKHNFGCVVLSHVREEELEPVDLQAQFWSVGGMELIGNQLICKHNFEVSVAWN
jgi:hypothetical protein